MQGTPVSIRPAAERAAFGRKPALHFRAAALFVGAFAEAEAGERIPERAGPAGAGAGVVDFGGDHRESRRRPLGQGGGEIAREFGGRGVFGWFSLNFTLKN